ncbi:hypothetical protein [Ornithinibacillus californiensis]|uniref:hypothetical protein n=1 Tax=Ornithinibacillus californiensis TaxID=161536 RepID=UPI00064DAF6A|nr:hypothetical protein [Ornithinibacillus californiensis]
MKKLLSFFAVVVILGLLTFAFLPGLIDQTQSKNAAKNVLENVIEQNYEKAFESIYYFDRESDVEPTISYEEAKKEWIQRVTDLRDEGVYLVDFKQLQVRLDDTYPKGTVDLVIMENGKESIKEDVSLWFARGDEKWKLGMLNYYHDEKEEEWEKALSGNFN